jgi:hypothetical protein
MRLLALAALAAFAVASSAQDDVGLSAALSEARGRLAGMKESSAARQAPAGPGTIGDDAGVVISYFPDKLWRDADGAFTAKREGDKIVITYAFFDAQEGAARYAACPPSRGTPAADCRAVQDAVAEAMNKWAEASGRLVLRRVEPGAGANIWIAWTDGFKGNPPRARVVDDTRSAASEPPEGVDLEAKGFGRPQFPRGRKAFSALLFNDAFCWQIAGGACPAPRTLPNGKTVSSTRDVRLTALHESGHAFGFGHFTVDTIMGVAGGSQRYQLTPYDRDAIRVLYDRVFASLAR